MSVRERPKLRKVERIEQQAGGQAVIVLRDPLELAEPVAISAEFAAVLDLLDGSKTLPQIRQTLLMRGELDLPLDDLLEWVGQLDQAGWLDSARFRELWAEHLDRWLAADPRPMAAAGLLYPEDSAALRAALERAVPSKADRMRPGTDLRGVLVPHGPPELTGPVLDETLDDLPPPDEVEVVLVLATDHGLGLTPYVGTAKRYATPLGVATVPEPWVEALERRVPWLRREEIRHRTAHAAEMAVLWLQHLYGEACPPILPILCGQSVLREDVADAADRTDRFVASLEALVEGRRVLWWGSAELSHAGPAYGRPSLDSQARQAIEDHDRACVDALLRGRARELVSRCREPQPQGRPSGGAVMSTLQRLLSLEARPELAVYQGVDLPTSTPGRIGLAGIRFRRVS